MPVVPVWLWLPGASEPVQAAELVHAEGGSRWRYLPQHLARWPVALDPVELRLARTARGILLRGADGLPGVLRDARPAGYGADRLAAQAGRELTALELLALGPPDGVGALEACADIERKLAWVPRTLQQLQALAVELDAAAPASRAMRRLHDDLETSAGGERPKATLAHAGRLWLAKMQDRGDRPALPAREFVAMSLAAQAGLQVAPVRLETMGVHQVLLAERFDRAGDPRRPQRRLYASAHTVLQLGPAAVRGDPARSYLHFADRLRVWLRGRGDLPAQLGELWRRMAFNALVGNVDDHPLNHGLLHDGSSTGSGWQLAPAFDVTPVLRQPVRPGQGPLLALATGADGLGQASAARLLGAAAHFGLDAAAAGDWLLATARRVAGGWEPLLRSAAAPVVEDAARMDALVADTRPAFSFSEQLASG